MYDIIYDIIDKEQKKNKVQQKYNIRPNPSDSLFGEISDQENTLKVVHVSLVLFLLLHFYRRL